MDVKYDPILDKLRERDTGGGSGGGDYIAGTGINSVALEGGTISVSNVPQSAVSGLTDALAGKQPTISSGATLDINITGSAASASSAASAGSAANATSATNATSAASAGYATTAGTANALSAGVVVASASAATTAGTATNATSATSAGYATTAGTANALSAGVVVASASAATTAGTATKATSATSAGYAMTAGTANALSAGVVVASASAAATAGTATNATSASSAGYATSAGTADALATGVVVASASAAATADAIASGAISGGYRMEIVSGSTISQKRWFPITNVTGNAVTMQPGEAYALQATTAAVTIKTTEIPSNQYGLESHLEIFVSGTGYVVTGTNVVLAQPLEPDSVNNCTVRFHDGLAIISVEDHVAGYIVVSATGTTAGTLPYALSSASQEYVAFDATLNGQMFDMGGVVTNREKHVVGNGYENTILTGGVSCTSKTTFANLAMSGVVNSGGTMTIGDVYIPDGGSVIMSGGLLTVENVTGDGGLIDLNGRPHITASSAQLVGVIVSGGSTSSSNPGTAGGAIILYGSNLFSSCTFTGNRCTGTGGAINLTTGAVLRMVDCNVTGNTATNGGNAATTSGTMYLTGCTVGDIYLYTATMYLDGSNTLTERIIRATSAQPNNTVYIAAGAVVDMTGNTSPSPISTSGGKIIVDNGGCTVINSAGTSIQITGGTYTKINNDGTTE